MNALARPGRVALSAVHPAAEVQRLRRELAELRRLADALVDALDPVGEIEYRRALCAEAAGRQHETSWRQGYEAAHRDMAVAWNEAASPIARGGPTHAELARRRWGPGGREHFGDPRPGDYPGRGGAAA